MELHIENDEFKHDIKKLKKKYQEIFIAKDKGYITADEAFLFVYLGEGLLQADEYLYWIRKLFKERIGK